MYELKYNNKIVNRVETEKEESHSLHYQSIYSRK